MLNLSIKRNSLTQKTSAKNILQLFGFVDLSDKGVKTETIVIYFQNKFLLFLSFIA